MACTSLLQSPLQVSLLQHQQLPQHFGRVGGVEATTGGLLPLSPQSENQDTPASTPQGAFAIGISFP